MGRELTKTVYQYTAIFEPNKNGSYTATIPALPGCISEGNTFEAAVKNIEEAASLYLEDLRADRLLAEFARDAQEIIVAPIKVMA